MIELSKEKFDAIALSQYDANALCSATSLQLIFNYFHILFVKENIVNQVLKMPQDNLLRNEGATNEIISNAFNICGTDYKGVYFKHESQYYNRKQTCEEIKNEIVSGQPILIVYQPDNSSSLHADALVGFDEIYAKKDLQITKLIIRDPWNNKNTVPTKGRLVLDAETFISAIKSFLTIRNIRE